MAQWKYYKKAKYFTKNTNDHRKDRSHTNAIFKSKNIVKIWYWQDACLTVYVWLSP